MRVGIVGMRAKLRLRGRLGAIEVFVKRAIEIRRRGPARHIRARLTEVVVNRDGALLEEQRGPRGGGSERIPARVVRILCNGEPERGKSVWVVEVVAELQPARAKRRRWSGVEGHRRQQDRRRRRAACHRHAPAHHVGRLGRGGA